MNMYLNSYIFLSLSNSFLLCHFLSLSRWFSLSLPPLPPLRISLSSAYSSPAWSLRLSLPHSIPLHLFHSVWLSLSLSLPVSPSLAVFIDIFFSPSPAVVLQCVAVCCSVLQCIAVYNTYTHETCLLFSRRASRVMLTKMYICACVHT